MSRGSLTTFSLANDVAKYFAIIPALFAATYPQLGALNVMHLASPQSAILSAVIFNALIIIALIPLALREVGARVDAIGMAPNGPHINHWVGLSHPQALIAPTSVVEDQRETVRVRLGCGRWITKKKHK